MAWPISKPRLFRGGVHLNEHKEETQHSPIESIDPPNEVVIPLLQHFGRPARPVVKRGDIVKRGQVVGEPQDLGVPVHASICGKVKRVVKQPHPILVETPAVVIQRSKPEDGVESLPFSDDPKWMTFDPSEMINRVRDAGIVGLGGATFPTYRKLSVPEQYNIDTLIINGAECEPYLTTDHRMMLETPEAIVWGAWLIAKTIGVKRCLFGIEDNKKDAAHALNETVAKLKPETSAYPVQMEVHITPTRYPQGSEKQLIHVLTNRQVPNRGLPINVGIVVQNVATAAACFEAIRYQKPLLDRIITVSGGGIDQPKNLRVPIGTSLGHIVTACGGIKDSVVKILHGGPMMGKALPTIDIPIIKATNGLLFLTQKETHISVFGPCIQCGQCLEACPLGLEPNRISVLVESGLPLQTERFGTHECFECGCCSYVCPAKRPLVQFIQVAKSAYRREKNRRDRASMSKEAAHE